MKYRTALLNNNMERDNLDKWMDQWEKAQSEDIFKDSAKPPVPTQNSQADDFFGNHRPQGTTRLNDVDAQYWNSVYRMSGSMRDSPNVLDDEEEHDPAMSGIDPVTISEDAPVGNANDFKLAPTTKPDGKSSSKITDDLGGLANPVHTSARGKDASNRVTPNWAGGQEIIELHKMKEQLQKLEDKIAADPMVENKGTKKVMSQIDALWKKIDELSDTLTPDFVQEYLS
jgi:hypothetical protein